MDVWIALLIILIGLVIYYYFKEEENFFEKHQIFYTKPLPFLGNMAPTLFRRISYMENIQNAYNLNSDAKYVGFFDFGAPVVIIRDMELVKSIVVKYFDHFVNHRGFSDPKYEPLFGNNLFELRDNKWREVRNLLSPAFTSSKMKSMFKLMSECAINFVDYLAEQAPTEVDAKDIFTRYTNDVIATCAFGISVDSMKNPKNLFYVLSRKATNTDGILSLKFFLMRSFPKFSKWLGIKLLDATVSKFFTELVRDTMAARDEQGITRPDMIQLLMETRNSDSRGPALTMDEMTAQAFVFLLGGLDTTALQMCFTTYEIAAHLDVQAKLQGEVDEVFEKYGDDPPYDAINGMVYLDAVITESLRLYPIATILDRVCNKEFELPPALPGKKPVTLQPGSCVWLPVYPFQRDPKHYPSPDEFSPERFVNEDRSGVNPSSPFLTFGLGPRMCIGNRFALLEMKVLLAHMLRKLSMKPAKRMVMPLKLSTSSFAMSAKGGFWLEFQSRNL